LPAGYDRYSVAVGVGPVAVERGRDAPRRWGRERFAGTTLFPTDAPLVPGTDVVASLQKGPLIHDHQRIMAKADDDGSAHSGRPGDPPTMTSIFGQTSASPDRNMGT
jgi:hypothetical protein